MGMGRFRRGLTSEAGFTVAELIVYIVIALVVVSSIYQILIGQNQLYTKQRELMDVRGSLRASAALLAWELRQSSPTNGDFYSIGLNSFAARSLQGSGLICAEHDTDWRYGLWASSGEFFTTADDSAMVLASGAGMGSGDDAWKVVRITATYDPTGGGVPTCFYGATNRGKGSGGKGKSAGKWDGTVVPDLVVEVSGDMNDVYIGAPLKAFRRIEYGLYQEDGRWWLGRKIGAAASYEKLTGPLRAPSDSGLVFTYYDQFGNVTADPTQVSLVDIILRGESYGKVRKGGGNVSPFQDTLTVSVSLRG